MDQPKLSKKQIDDIISRFIQTQQGRAALARAMVSPIRCGGRPLFACEACGRRFYDESRFQSHPKLPGCYVSVVLTS